MTARAVRRGSDVKRAFPSPYKTIVTGNTRCRIDAVIHHQIFNKPQRSVADITRQYRHYVARRYPGSNDIIMTGIAAGGQLFKESRHMAVATGQPPMMTGQRKTGTKVIEYLFRYGSVRRQKGALSTVGIANRQYR